MGIVSSLIVAAVAGLLVYLVGSVFDKTANNHYSGIAGLVVFVLVFLSSYGRIDL